MLTNEEFEQQHVRRRIVFESAAELVGPIVLEHGLESQKGSAAPFHVAPTFSKVDQHIDQIIRVADWLLESN